MDHISSVDNKLVASLDKTSQTLYDLGVNALSKFQSLQDSEKLSECRRQPPGCRPEDRRNGDGTEVYDPSEEEMNFQRALDDAMEESSHLVAFARDACTKWGAYKAHVNTTVVRSASNELAYTEAAFELRKENILTIERCYGSTEAAEAVDNDATGEPNTTLETELPRSQVQLRQ